MKKFFSLLICLSLLFAASCSQSTGETTESESTQSNETQSTLSNTGTYFDTDIWQAVPMISQELIDAGWGGGEGCQQVLCPILDPVEGKVGFFGTDVAGLYKTADGGKTWSISTVGFTAAGATGPAIDPNNTNRVLIVGANSGAQPYNGLYLSTDCGDSWSYVQEATTYGYRDFRVQIAFDESSYDESVGGSKIVYWSRENDPTNNTKDNDPSLYKSEDGGQTWKQLPGTKEYGGAYIAVHKDKGWLYVANENGVFVSKDGAGSFTKILDKAALSMDVTRTAPDKIYVTTTEGLYVSSNAGESWNCINGTDYPSFYPTRLKVSPADSNYMILQDDHTSDSTNKFGHVTWYSHDGGQSWKKSKRIEEGSWVPLNSARTAFCWDPNDKNRLICNWNPIFMSQDGGATFKWSNTGFNGICPGGGFNWNVNHPMMMSFGSQDYNGGYTLDGGKTWTYVNWSGNGWGGFTYGSYILNENVIATGVSSDWLSRGGKIELCVTYDGGKTITHTGNIITGSNIGMGVPGNDDIAFLGEWRTEDCGRTWNKMDGCTGVFTADYKNGTLFGVNKYEIVKSDDNGLSWSKITSVSSIASDMCYNYNNNTLFVAVDEKFYSYDLSEEKPKMKTVNVGESNASCICIDPTNPDVMYAACSSNVRYSVKNVWRSLDAGKTWTLLSRQVGDGRTGPDGARRTCAMRVNPQTRELFAFGGCKGLWKIPGPQI
jgi:photosystem II stability/assembly factor-like uncharacterized protein